MNGVEKSKPSPINGLAARIGVICGWLFIGLLAGLHFIKPELDPSWNPISEYALGKHGWVMTAAFLALATSCVATFIAIRSQVSLKPGKVGLFFILLAALGFAIAAIFPTDPIMTKSDALTTGGMLHSVGAVLADGIPLASAFVGVPLLRRNNYWQSMRNTLIGGMVLAWSAFVLVTVSLILLAPDGQLGPDVKVGWQSRYMMGAYALWLILMCWSALKVKEMHRPVNAGGLPPTTAR